MTSVIEHIRRNSGKQLFRTAVDTENAVAIVRPTNAMTNKPHDASGRIPSLDGIRAVSILAVLYHHAKESVNFPALLEGKPFLYVDGKIGVRVFFVISGFLITTLLLKELAKTGRISLSAFYKRRALRILPVYYVFILTVLMISRFGIHSIPAANFFSASIFTTDLWGKWEGPNALPLAHTWSLSIEEQFYLTWPGLLVLLGPRFAGKIWIPFLFLMAPILRFFMWQNVRVDFLFITQGDSIAAGCLLALLMQRRQPFMEKIVRFKPTFGRIAAVTLIFSHVIVGTILRRLDLAMSYRVVVTLLPTIQCLATAYLIASLVMHRHGIGYALMNLAPIQWLGRLSYSLYIWQQIFLFPAVYFYPATWKLAGWMTQFPQNIVFAFAAAMLSYYCLEQPMLRLKNRFTKVKTASA